MLLNVLNFNTIQRSIVRHKQRSLENTVTSQYFLFTVKIEGKINEYYTNELGGGLSKPDRNCHHVTVYIGYDCGLSLEKGYQH